MASINDPLRRYMRERQAWRLGTLAALILVPTSGIAALVVIAADDDVRNAQLLAPVGILVGAVGATFTLLFNVLSNSRTLYYSKASNVEKVFISFWKDKKFSKPVSVDLSHIMEMKRNINPGKFIDSIDLDPDLRQLETRSVLRICIRHLYFPQTLNYDDSKEIPDFGGVHEPGPDPLKEILSGELAFWQSSLTALRSMEDARSWEFKAVYELSLGLQDLGALVRGGTLPLDLVLVSGARLIIEDWLYIQSTVLQRFRRDATNMTLKPVRRLNSRGGRLSRWVHEKLDFRTYDPWDKPEYWREDMDSLKLGAMRRHAEWLALIACIYWRRNYSGGTTDLLIAEIESYYEEFCRSFHNDADKIDFMIDAQLLKPGETRTDHSLGSIPNIVYRERLLRAADLMVFGELSMRHLALDGLVGHSIHTQAQRAYSRPAA